MQLNGMLYGSRLLGHVDFPASEVLGPDAGEDAIQDLIARHGLIFIKPVFRGGVGKKGKAGLIGKATRPQDRARRKGAALLRRAPPRQRLCQGERRDLRGRHSGRARGLFRHHRRHAFPRADHDADPSRRRRHRGAAEVRHRHRALRGADRAEGLRGSQRAHRHRRAARDHLAAGAAPAEALGARCTTTA